MMERDIWAARDSITFIVNENPSEMTVERVTKYEPDGFGGWLKSRDATPEKKVVRFRLAHDKSRPQILGNNEQVFNAKLNRIATWEWDTDIQEGDSFASGGRVFTFGVVDELKMFGGVIGYQAPITSTADASPATIDDAPVASDGWGVVIPSSPGG